jgi:2-C-methyl-D-erythritol 4-phosphate cytidylyltransferase/2-C-methyl-D-erythritol 2,4-cyclodiphosphate synthase
VTRDIAIVVVAAGRGSRAGAGLPKQYRLLAGRPLIAHTLSALAAAAPDACLQVVIHPDDEALYAAAVQHLEPRPADLRRPVYGHATRQASVRAGLEALAESSPRPDLVLIHDGARPFPSPSLIARAIAAGRQHGAAIPVLPISDTIAEVDDGGRIVATPERSVLRAVQTPQVFRFELILAAHREAAGRELTDDASVAARAGQDVHVFAGEATNMKVTTEVDLAAAEARLTAGLGDIRSGQGYDVHAFGPGDHVFLGGVRIAHSHGLVGHSDADVLIHAIADALYGALAEADIGAHFPPSDPTWKGAASDIFLRHAVGRVRARGGMVAHIDATLVCEAPKLSPHREAIRARLAEIAGLPLERIAVKATTSEGLGFTGRREGIAALALATVRLPGAVA